MINGQPTFRSKASILLHNFYSHDLDTDKMKLVDTAVTLIREDIKAVTVYPSFDEEGPDKCINFLPPTLKSLLEGLIKGKKSRQKLPPLDRQLRKQLDLECYWHQYRLGWECSYLITLNQASSLIHCTIMVSAASTNQFGKKCCTVLGYRNT
jgi:hypothetical protein